MEVKLNLTEEETNHLLQILNELPNNTNTYGIMVKLFSQYKSQNKNDKVKTSKEQKRKE